ncbi:MAG: Adenine DNA glycosylase [Phycisphaerae bacterium]|nr:Adenine DNA glycosylase [Phycisphaerae bacterium]
MPIDESSLSVLTRSRSATIRARLLAWYDASRRDLPWRRDPPDPYHIWVSEVMLQQTQVATVVPYWRRFVRRFPDVQSLAAAPIEEVLRAWGGLGYYRRAHQLHAAARELAARGGTFPRDVPALERLPGIGRYTAGAIASIAFGRRAALVDGNVARVLSRAFHPLSGAGDAEQRADCWRIAERLVPAERPGDFNQALMELGATCCTPAAPRCADCPLRRSCAARRAGVQDRVPPARRRLAASTVEVVALVALRRGEVLLERRPAGGLWAGLWDVPSEVAAGASADEVRGALERLASRVGVAPSACRPVGEIRRTLTHRRLRFHVYVAWVDRRVRRDGWRWAKQSLDGIGVSRAAQAVLELVRRGGAVRATARQPARRD